MGKGEIPCPLPLVSLHHVSLVCKSVETSSQFYKNVLGFQLVKRPSSFDFEGARLFNYGVGIHLLQCKSVDDLPKKSEINPRDNHISFQCSDVGSVEKKLEEINIKYKKRVVEKGGVCGDEIFFHDPDGYMIGICNFQNLPLGPLTDSYSYSQPRPVNSSRFSWLKSRPKKQIAKENLSEIPLLAANSNPVESKTQLCGFTKDVEADVEVRCWLCPSEERRCVCPSEAEKPLFLDIMNFYL